MDDPSLPQQTNGACSGELRLLGIDAAVAYLRSIGATTATRTLVRTLWASGELPYVKVGKAFCTSRESVDSWIRSHERRRR